MKILSIDYDYFQKVKQETLKTFYPDGIDNNPLLSEVVWAGYYALNAGKLRAVHLNKTEYAELIYLLLHQKHTIPVLVSHTHKDIYKFIHDVVPSKRESLTIVNVDMHHDFMNGNDTVDCGNWVSFIKKEYKNSKLIWVANPISLKMYGAPELEHLVKQSISEISDMQFDAIFLCRSDTWTPPHLDKHFERLLHNMVSIFKAVQCEKIVEKPRKAYLTYAKKEREFFKKEVQKN